MATVAASVSLPEEPLYGLKLAAEQVRLDLARSPEDRAAVELSIAEHRLAEAERLALDGQEDAALAAWSEYGSRVAIAAAELAEVELVAPKSAPLVAQLESRMSAQRAKAALVARRLAADPKTAQSGRALATIATTLPEESGGTVSVRIADTAARVAQELANVAAERAQLPTAAPRAGAATTPRPQAAAAPQPGRAVKTPNASARTVAEAAKKAAERASEAAKKARENAERVKEFLKQLPAAKDHAGPAKQPPKQQPPKLRP
jgi:hypothetical protein